MSWHENDEVVTTFGSIKQAQEEAFNDGVEYEAMRILRRLKAVMSSCGAPGCPSCRGLSHAIEEIASMSMPDERKCECGRHA